MRGGIACVLALFSITADTLYQKQYCERMDLRTATGVVTRNGCPEPAYAV